ncbi:MAG TPA: HAD family hydrolase [Longimicrobiales bacterium]|nr:HAD family hydrolase [Longimicrobiales bacterium]
MPESAAAPGPRPAAFLDRDGTVIVEREYLARPEDVELIPGAAAGLKRLADAGYALVLVSNQSGIARGLYGEADHRAVQARLEALLRDAGVVLDGDYHCPHHPDFTGPCDCRKPAPGLFLRAARELGLDLSRSVYIGDRLRDVLPGLERGGRAFLVRTGYGAAEAAAAPAAVHVADDVRQAAAMVVDAG